MELLSGLANNSHVVKNIYEGRRQGYVGVPIDSGIVSLHEFSEILRKVCRRVLSAVLAVEPFVSF